VESLCCLAANSLFGKGGPAGLVLFFFLFFDTGTKTTPSLTFYFTIQRLIILTADWIGKQIG
jgi:hypothetical protein